MSVLEWSKDKAEDLRQSYSGEVVVTVGDVRSLEDNRRALAATLDRFGKLDVLVGNAGIQDGGFSFLQVDPEKLDAGFDDVMGVNVKGYILAAHVCAAELVKTLGSMVFTASSASFIPGGGGLFYTASKHAVVGVVRELAYQLAPQVRVNAVAPGPMRTDLRGSSVLGSTETVYAPTDPA
ncbi:MAG: SDR family NAD(P)-dependent oxidoreductase, partial [Burkholderia sp.]|nr:SDR family NAD(P)-dependent oxidoreductase [Burkholderia sp.]